MTEIEKLDWLIRISFWLSGFFAGIWVEKIIRRFKLTQGEGK